MRDKMRHEQDAPTEDYSLTVETAKLFHEKEEGEGWHNKSKNVQTAVLNVYEQQVVPRERKNIRLKTELEDAKMADLVGELGVFSRRALDARLMKIAERNIREEGGEGMLILMGDVDNLKLLNETASDKDFEHSIGDAGLYAVAETLIESTRPGDVVARVGGDEFVVMCEAGSIELARTIVEGTEGNQERLGLIARIRQGVEKKRQQLKEQFGADWPEDGEKKKPGQLSMGWSYISGDELGRLYRQYVTNNDNEGGVNKSGDFVSMFVKEADKNMFIDKKSKD